MLGDSGEWLLKSEESKSYHYLSTLKIKILACRAWSLTFETITESNIWDNQSSLCIHHEKKVSSGEMCTQAQYD